MAEFDVADLWESTKTLTRRYFDSYTHCMEMWSDHFSGDHTADVHFTADGITGLVKSTVDGRFYRIVITPYEGER